MFKKLKEKLYPWKQWLESVFVYPKMGERDENYEKYWEERGASAGRSLNRFQKKRAELVLKYIEPNSVVMDVGCGNGGTLLFINDCKPMKKLIGVDLSPSALAMARENGIEAITADISKQIELDRLPSADYVILFEALEHLPNSEEVLGWAVGHAQKGVFFSVPNTGFFAHRLRLLLGRFPLQWRVRPSEHLRFWTVRDMNWWLGQLGYENYILKLYEGPSVLNKLWSPLFTQGIWVYLPATAFQDNINRFQNYP